MLYRAKQSKAKQSKAKQSKAKQSKAKQSKAKQSKAKESKAKQSKAKQSKAKQSKAKQSKQEGKQWFLFGCDCKAPGCSNLKSLKLSFHEHMFCYISRSAGTLAHVWCSLMNSSQSFY